MIQSARHTFALDHPTASGHFPGDPIIPGAVLLDAVLGAVCSVESVAEHGGASVVDGMESRPQSARVTRAPIPGYTLVFAKFLHPVRPGDELAITWRSGAAGEMRFECQVDGRSVLAGALRANASGALS